MMESLRRWIKDEGRSRARWTAFFLALLLATLIWPTVSAGQAAAKSQIIWLWSFAFVFQLGRLIQTWKSRDLLLDPAPRLEPGLGIPATHPEMPAFSARVSPGVAAAPASKPFFSAPVRRSPTMIEIRAYASLDEAAESGWEFEETVAFLGGIAVPKLARFNGVSYEYSGLLANRGNVPADTRVFGRLSYRLPIQEPPAAVA